MAVTSRNDAGRDLGSDIFANEKLANLLITFPVCTSAWRDICANNRHSSLHEKISS
ncbi:hypothetical protein DPMN_118041 [Dreissena polymorpha]|uniref:Uncharacterized protein n=1 Tax=Dreissena polymorpha TaxID=45954 RepID=A0A9D4GJG1_DREPO|nr:hypothetical protein DPMN_118041 [Dreissena polymorpha]